MYRQIISVAASDLYAAAKPTDKQQADMDRYDGDVTEAVREIKGIRQETLKEWKDYATQAGLTPGTPAYDLERATF